MERTLDRKRLTIQKQIVKATNQLRAGLTYAKEADGVVIEGDTGPMSLPLGGRQLLGLIVIREMFDHDQQENSDPVLALIDDIQLPVMLIDYPALDASMTLLPMSAFRAEAAFAPTFRRGSARPLSGEKPRVRNRLRRAYPWRLA